MPVWACHSLSICGVTRGCLHRLVPVPLTSHLHSSLSPNSQIIPIISQFLLHGVFLHWRPCHMPSLCQQRAFSFLVILLTVQPSGLVQVSPPPPPSLFSLTSPERIMWAPSVFSWLLVCSGKEASEGKNLSHLTFFWQHSVFAECISKKLLQETVVLIKLCDFLTFWVLIFTLYKTMRRFTLPNWYSEFCRRISLNN